MKSSCLKYSSKLQKRTKQTDKKPINTVTEILKTQWMSLVKRLDREGLVPWKIN